MWIRFLKPVGEHKVNDFLDCDEAVARAYVTTGQAAEDKDGPERFLFSQARDGFTQEIATIRRELADTMRSAAQGLRGTGPRIELVESEDDKTRGAHDFVRNVFLADGGSRDPADVSAAHERLTKVYGCKRGMTEGSGAAGGYTTPTVYESQVQEIEAEDQIILPYATPVPLGARTVEWPALDQYAVPTAGQSAFFGGMKVSRKGEVSQRSASQPAFKKIALTAMDITAYTEISRDLIMDSTTPQDAYVTRLIGEAIGWRNDWESLNGSGAGQFLGIYNAPCTISVTRNTGSTVKYVDLTGMYKRLLPSSRKNAVWVVHPYTLDALLNIVDSAGRYIFQPTLTTNGDSTLGAAPKWQMFGLPVIDTEKAPALGATGDVGLFDRKRYLYGRRAGLEIGLSEHFKFDTDQIAIRAKERNDGQPQLKGPIVLADGTSTVSGFVVLN